MSRAAARRPRRVSPTVLKLSSLLRKSASITFRRELALQSAEWRALALIGDDGPLSHGALCELMAQDKGQVSRVVASLVADDMVVRQANGRSITLSLAGKGRAIYERLTVISYQRNDRLLAGLKATEIRMLFHCLDVMTENAVQLMSSEAAGGSMNGPGQDTDRPAPAALRQPRRSG